MINMISVAVAVHVLSAVVWVGGMFFAYAILRPSIGVLEPPLQRLKLWNRVFRRFFLWVWAAIVILTASGFYLINAVYGELANVGVHIHLMYAIASAMIILFFALYFGPFKTFSDAVNVEDGTTAITSLASIRRIVAVNLTLGLITVAAGASGRYWL